MASVVFLYCNAECHGTPIVCKSGLFIKHIYKYTETLQLFTINLKRVGVYYFNKVIEHAKLKSLGTETSWTMRNKRRWSPIAQRVLLNCQLGLKSVCYK
jgi:hypothetical protein